MIPIAQGYAAGAWLLVTLYFLPELWRAMRLRADPMAIFCTLWATTGIVQVGFTVRWFLFAHTIAYMGGAERTMWLVLYYLSGITANTLVIYAALFYRRKAL